MQYARVIDVCHHEDYPCCGCSTEEYLLPKSEAQKLKKKGVIRIIGYYTPMEFY